MATLTAAAPAGAPAPLIADGCPPDWPWSRWADLLDDVLLSASTTADPATHAAAAQYARHTGRSLLSLRIGAAEVRLGPLWAPDGGAACPACADTAARRGPAPARPGVPAPWLPPVVEAVLRGGIAPDTVVTVSGRGQVRRHPVARDPGCAVCGRPADPASRVIALRPRAASPTDPTRAHGSAAPVVAAARRLSGGRRFGLLDRHVRLSRAAFPVAEIGLRQGTPVGMGRGSTVREADDVALLEAFERLSGHARPDDLVRGVSAAELGSTAVALHSLGRCSERQLRSPLCRVRRFDERTAMDWAWAQPATGGAPVLVPADIAYPWYRYPDEPGTADPRRSRYFLDSSSGTALGATPEEALLHALFELVERDQFQLAWHRRTPLPRLDPAGVTDPQSRLLMHVIDRSGFDLHLLIATADIALPVVWAVAVNRAAAAPATFSTAGAHPDPARAVRAALWELAQQASSGIGWDVDSVPPLVADPWQVSDLEDHWRRYTDPALLPRVLACIGSDTVAPAEAFPGWPDRFVTRARGDLLRAVHVVTELLADAGLSQVLAVDQSTDLHAAAGVSVVRAVVPGIIGLNFGQANQRYTGVPRLLDGVGVDDPAAHPGSLLPLDPHPFP